MPRRKKYEVNPKRPTINNEASIFEWNLEVRCLWKNQFDKLFKYLVDKEYDFSWEKEEQKYLLKIYSVSWASNLVEFAKILQESDYDLDAL